MSFKELLKKWIPPFLQMSREHRGDLYALNRLKQWLQFLRRHYVDAEILFENIKQRQTLEELRRHESFAHICLDPLSDIQSTRKFRVRCIE